MKNELDEIVQSALDVGAVEDAAAPVQGNERLETKATEKIGAYRWEPKERDPWTNPSNLRLSENPLGVCVAESLHAEGNLSAEDLEVVRELSPIPAQYVLSASDSEEALRLIETYTKYKVIDQEQALSLAENFAHIEARREREQAAQIEAEARREREAAEAEAQKTEQQEKARDEIWDRYYSVRDRLDCATVETDQAPPRLSGEGIL